MYSTLKQTLLFLLRHGSANRGRSCWRITQLQGRSLGWIRGTANTLLSGGKNRWLSSICLAEEEEEEGHGGDSSGRGEGKHDLAPMISTGAHAKVTPTPPTRPPPSNQTKYTWDTARGGAWGIGIRVRRGL